MKKVSVEEFAQDAKTLLETIKRERVVVMKNGKPLAILTAVKNKDEEDLALEEDPAFWQMIRERRKEKTIPFSEVKKRLGLDKKRTATRKNGKQPVSARRSSAKR